MESPGGFKPTRRHIVPALVTAHSRHPGWWSGLGQCLDEHDACSIGDWDTEIEAKALPKSPFNARSVIKTRADQSETWLDAG
jgi:hypothetical protein